MPWDVGQKKFIRDNGRNTGPTIWNSDSVAAQPIDSLGHDTQDQDIADGITQTLNINGINAMLADLDVGTFKLLNVADGTVSADGTNFGQLTVVDGKADQGISDAAAAQATADTADGKADTNATDIANLQTGTTDAIITAMAFDGANLTSDRVDGDFVVPLKDFNLVVATTFKSKGQIRHLLNDQGAGPAAIDVLTYNRHRVNNDGALTMTFSGMPSANDTDFSNTPYMVEGSITIQNGASPGTIAIAGLSSPVSIGEQNLIANAAQVLSYKLEWISPTLYSTLIWSAEA